MTLLPALIDILQIEDPRQKAERTRGCVADWRAGALNLETFLGDWPAPASRVRPPLKPPDEMPRRGLGSIAGRQALLHAVAHIELNAIDLAVDMAGRFGPTLPKEDRSEFISDWLSVADDEARHFVMIADRLEELGAAYGDLPAHNGLWQAAKRTEQDVLARLAIAPLVLEARGLDVTPGMIEKLHRNQDHDSADLLQVIYREEVGHVATGSKWFRRLCAAQHHDPETLFHLMVKTHFPGGLKRPFNDEARARSDFPEDWYAPLADLPSTQVSKV